MKVVLNLEILIQLAKLTTASKIDNLTAKVYRKSPLNPALPRLPNCLGIYCWVQKKKKTLLIIWLVPTFIIDKLSVCLVCNCKCYSTYSNVNSTYKNKIKTRVMIRC